MNTLVIGGGGFVGQYLIAELTAGGHRHIRLRGSDGEVVVIIGGGVWGFGG